MAGQKPWEMYQAQGAAPAEPKPWEMFGGQTAPKDDDQGVTGTLWQGTKSAARAIGATANAYMGDTEGVMDKATAQREAPKDARLEQFYGDVQRNTEAAGEDPGLLDSIGAVGEAVIDNPAGAGLAVLEQIPNSLPMMAGGYAGFKGGAAAGAALGTAIAPGPGTAIGGAAGAVLGGLTGMFLGNAAIETGHKAMGAADDGEVTQAELDTAKREGAVKAVMLTGVDGFTLGAGSLVSGAMQRTTRSALEAATRKALTDRGVDVTNEAAVLAARNDPAISAAVRAAQDNAAKAADTFGRRAAEAGTLLSMETVGEGVGEYLGELAATGEGNVTDAVLESMLSLGQSGAETAFNMTRARKRNGLWQPSEAQPATEATPEEPTPEVAAEQPQEPAQPDTVQPMPSADNPTPAPVQRPDPAAGPLSAAANLLQPAGPVDPETMRLRDAMADIDRRARLGGMTPMLAAERHRLDIQLAAREQARTAPRLTDQRPEGFTVDAQGNAQPSRMNSQPTQNYEPGGPGMTRQTPRGEQAPMTGQYIMGGQPAGGALREPVATIDGEIVGRGQGIGSDNRPRLTQQSPVPDEQLADTGRAAAADMIRQAPQKPSEWVLFGDRSGSLNIPRDQMPQIKADSRGAFSGFLRGRGIASQEQTVRAATLRPTQAEFSTEKVKQAKQNRKGTRAILVSSDGYILDGHHQWLVARERDEEIKVQRIDAPIRDLLPLAAEFPSATVEPTKPTKPAKPVRRGVDRDRDSVVRAVIRLGGLQKRWKQDTTSDTKGNKNLPGVGALWTDKTGTTLDDMASLLDQYGYVPAGEMEKDGGVSWLQGAIRDEVGGIKTHYAPDSAMQIDAMEQEALDRYAEQVAQALEQREAEYAQIEAQYGPDAAAEARAFDQAIEAYDQQLEQEIDRDQDTLIDGEPLAEADAARRDDELRQADAAEGGAAGATQGPAAQVAQQGSVAEQLASMDADALGALIDEVTAETNAPETSKPLPKRRVRSQGADGKPRQRPVKSKAEQTDTADQAAVARTAGAIAKSLGVNMSSAGMNALEGLTKLFGGAGRLSSGLSFDEETYAKAKPYFAAAMADIQAAGKDLRDFIRALVGQFGDGVKPYILRYAQDLKQEQDNGADQRVESDRPADAELGAGADLRDAQPGQGGRGADALGEDGRAERGTGAGAGDGADGAAAAGERGNQPVDATEPGVDAGAAGGADGGRGRPSSTGGLHAERTADGAADRAPSLAVAPDAKADVKASDKPAAVSAIKAQMPFLTEGQAEDVAFAERRLLKPEGHGVLFTNGTGTGKTFTGLGIVARAHARGKRNILVVAPKQTIVDAWVKAADRFFDLPVKVLASTQDNGGTGIVATTYANLSANGSLAQRDWDMVVADEAHYLSSAKDGATTAALSNLRALTKRRGHERELVRLREAEKVATLAKLTEEAGTAAREGRTEDRQSLERRADLIRRELDALTEQEREAWKAIEPIDKTRAVFLSATPFAYEKSVQWAQEFLFDWGQSESQGYNAGGSFERFMMQHFGYRMRHNKLTEPNANVDRGLMQRAFNSWLKREGALSSRALDSQFDYDRTFVTVESPIGRRVDEALKWLSNRSRGRNVAGEPMNLPEEAVDAFRTLNERIAKGSFDYRSRMYFLEAIKAREALPHIRAQLAAGRKVLVMHDFKQGGAVNPFRQNLTDPAQRQAYAQFASEFDDLIRAFSALPSPIDQLRGAFPDALVYNGNVSAKQRLQMQNAFNDDADDAPRLMVAQGDAMREGVSIHDTTGKFPRVLVHLGMPVKPTAAIQQEGRIYRTGQASNAMFRYFTIGTGWERAAFASKIASRAGAAENLAMGEQARGLKQAFIDAYESADLYEPGFKGEGTGGKSADRAAAAALTPWDQAKSFYFGTKQQGRGRSAAGREGADYFATPEPVGLKMVEWADIRGGESVLEPSAGHGAIARWFPENARVRVIEQSADLASRVALHVNGDVVQGDFEAHNIVNKYDAIVMNPPFGQGGATAIAHLSKAAGHLRSGGRLVALIPTGPAADKRFDAWLYGKDKNDKPLQPDLQLVGEVRLPPATFERAGTSVATRIVIIDRDGQVEQTRQVDLSREDGIAALFDRLESLVMPARGQASGVQQAPTSAVENVSSTEGRSLVTDAPLVEHVTKKGKKLSGVIVTDQTLEQVREAVDPYAFRKDGGVFVRAEYVKRPVRYRLSDSLPGPGINAIAARTLKASLEKATGLRVEVAATEADLPEAVRRDIARDGVSGRVAGVYRDGVSWVVANQVDGMKGAISTVLHEAVGHQGVHAVLGKRIGPAMLQIHRDMPANIRQTLQRMYAGQLARLSDTEQRILIAEEYVAHLAETDPKNGFVSRVIASIRSFLREVFGDQLAMKWSRADLVQLLAESRQAVGGGKRAASSRYSVAETPAFKRWFGDSKVVDENGRPLVVYHATSAEFGEFDFSRLGEFTREVADAPEAVVTAELGAWTNTAPVSKAIGQRIDMPLYLSIENPLVIRFDDLWSLASEYETGTEMRDALEQDGYDGLAVDDTELGGTSYVAFRPEQIKSAIGNNGDFDPGNPDIRYSLTGDLKSAFERTFGPAPLDPADAFAEENRRLREEDRTLWDKAKKVFARQFAPGGLLPKSVFAEKITRDKEFEVVEFEVRHLTGALGRAVRAQYGVDIDNLTDAQMKQLSEGLVGKLDPSLPEETKAALVAMRQYIDRLSSDYLTIIQGRIDELKEKAGTTEQAAAAAKDARQAFKDAMDASTDPELVQALAQQKAALRERKVAKKAIKGLKGDAKKAARQALNAAVQAHERAKSATRKAMSPELRKLERQAAEAAAAANAARSAQYDAEAESALYEKIKANIGAYVHRSYQAFDDPKWFKSVPTETLNAARRYLIDGYLEMGETEAEARRMAEVTMGEILKTGTAYDTMEAMISEGKLGAKDLSVLVKRKEIAPEIRALLGEYQDPRLNFAKSATKMGRLIWNQRFLDRVREVGLGSFLFTENDRPADATVQIAGEQSDVYAPLNGLWTFPEVAQAFKDALGKEQMSDLYRTVVRLNGMVKYGKTVLSPTTAMRNWQSAMFFSLANGHFDMSQMKKSWAAFREQVMQSATGDDLAYLRKLKRLGVVYDTPYAGEMMALLQDARMEELMSSKTGTGIKLLRKVNQFAQGFYSFGDDFWKIIGFENEKAGLIKAGLSEAEAETEAASRIRATYPTYSMIGRGIQWLRRFPLAGTFVSFPAEIIRTSANMLKITAADLKSENPKMRELGRKRAAGMAMVSAGFYALAALSAAATGVDDDEEEAVRDLSPPWSKNSTFLFLGRNEDGQLRYVDLSFLDPYGYWKRPLTAMLRDQPWQDAATSGLADMLSPFFGADIAASAIFEVMSNQKPTGGQVYNENADSVDQLQDIANHMRKALQPGFIGNAERLILASQEARREGSGQPYDMRNEAVSLVGWRASTLDARTGLYYRAFDFTDALSDARKTLTRTLRSSNEVSDGQILEAREAAEAQYTKAFAEMSRLVSASQAAGLTQAEIAQTLKLSSVPQANIMALLRGTIPPMQIGLQAQAKAIQQAGIMRDSAHAAEVARRFRVMREQM